MKILSPKNDLSNKTLMVNAGSTCEDIDPVRFITNRGTGKMGFALAREAAERGADVILVSGPSQLQAPPQVKYIPVWSAQEMCDVMLKYQPECDIIIGAAAVGDFRTSNVASQKIKKTEDKSGKFILELIENPDILKELGKRKQDNLIMVGFAAETQNVLENAQKKLISKNLDLIVANDVTMEGAGFASDTNIVTIINRTGEVKALPKMSKDEVAAAIIDKITELI
jgi:phosphopantothenoylcysteine decarboxylase/phosphopantothenate--cysteine ligase